MTRARARALQQEVNIFLDAFPLYTSKDGMLPHGWTLCVLRYEDPLKEEQVHHDKSMSKPLMGWCSEPQDDTRLTPGTTIHVQYI